MTTPRILTHLALASTALLGASQSATADTVIRFDLVNVTYGTSGVLDGTFTYDFTTNQWVTCLFLNGQINGNPLVSPVSISPSLLTGDYSTQTWSYNYEVPLATTFTATTAGVVFVDPPGTPADQLTSFFVIDDGLGNPNSVVTYPITGGTIVPVDSGTPFCFGDGTQSLACPCGNTGIAGHGCDNSSATGGALLTSSGATSINYDSLQFNLERRAAHGAHDLPPGLRAERDRRVRPGLALRRRIAETPVPQERLGRDRDRARRSGSERARALGGTRRRALRGDDALLPGLVPRPDRARRLPADERLQHQPGAERALGLLSRRAATPRRGSRAA